MNPEKHPAKDQTKKITSFVIFRLISISLAILTSFIWPFKGKKGLVYLPEIAPLVLRTPEPGIGEASQERGSWCSFVRNEIGISGGMCLVGSVL